MENQPSGFILLDKPAGPTSFGMVAFLRRTTGIKKIGHAGTLDPFATGLLIMGVGRQATRQLDSFLKQEKEYEATLRLGARTDTFDIEGEIKDVYSGEEIKNKEIKKIVASFKGKQKQTPPMFSAKKIGGKKLYELARAGKEIFREPSNIEIIKIKVLKYKWPELKIVVACSSGTYIRSLANDIGLKLGCGAYLTALRRTKIGRFNVKSAIVTTKITSKNWQKLLKNL
jgi:tRNA pseudouridine55 synthase